jgi:integrase
MTLAKKKRRKSNLIRSKFPKIRTQRSSCGIVYQVDARRQGTSAKGNRFTFRTKAEAQKKASEIEKEYALKGMEGMSLDFDLRSMALKGQRVLEPYGKTIDDAVLYYADHLKREVARTTSAFVSDLADKWYTFKSKSNGNKILREASIKNILEATKELKRDFGSKRLLDISQHTMQEYLDAKAVGQQRKKNIRDLFFRFFKWCVEQGYSSENPLQKIKIVVEEKDEVPIMTVDEAERIMRVCEVNVPEALIYYAICLFAGLRPSECKRLIWENVLESEGVIRVLRSTSKTGWRTVKIEPTLQAWLSSFDGKKKGSIITQKGYRWFTEKARVKAGYKLQGKNPDGKEWAEDLTRHTFASYWLPIHKLRPILAEEMGNSKNVIDQHYRQFVPPSEAERFWKILPTSAVEETKRKEKVVDDLVQKVRNQKPLMRN